MVRVRIVADDLSGAADCAAAFAGPQRLYGLGGRQAIVRLRPGPGGAAAVVATDTDARALTPGYAAEASVAAMRAFLDEPAATGAGAVFPYLKMDSTLRGNFAAELAALLAAFPQLAGAVVCPAFPEQGRSVRIGHGHLNGVPLERTEVWKANRIEGDADLVGMLARGGVRAARLGLEDLARSPEALALRLRERFAAGAQAVVCDADSRAHLNAIAAALLALPSAPLAVGSAGLARSLSGLLLREGGKPQACAAPGAPGEGLPAARTVAIVVGTRATIARAQVEALAQASGALHESPDGRLLLLADESRERLALRARLAQALGEGRDVVLSVAPSVVDAGTSFAIASGMAGLIAPMAAQVGAWMMTGGDTARAVLAALDIEAFEIAGEVEPGVPLALTLPSIPGGPRIPLCIKAGAFGDAETLARCVALLHAGTGGLNTRPEHAA